MSILCIRKDVLVGLFDCFCSHNGCPGKKGFTTVEGLKKHMHKLKTTWVGQQEQMGAGHSVLTPTHQAEPTNGAAEDTCILICALISAKKSASSLQQAMTSRGAAQNERENSTPSTSGTLQDDGPSNAAASPEPMEEPMDITDQQEEQGLGQHAPTPISIPEATGPMESDHALYDPMDGLIHHPYLDTLNLVVDPELKALCCQQCQVALILREALAHMHGQHKGLQVNKEHFLHMLGQLEIHEDLPEPYFGCVIPPFKGLKTHHTEDHRDTAMPRTWAACKMQQFNRKIPRHDHDALLPGLKAAEGRYFEEALSHLPLTDELVLQRLNSPDPLKSGINNTPLHHHQNEDTMAKYTLPVLSLIWMLAWAENEDRYSLPLPDTLSAKITALRQALADGVDASDRIHEVLTALWMSKWVKTRNNLIPCPTERVLALLTLDRDGKHKEPVVVTGILAQLEYCVCLVCLKELKQLSVASFGENDEMAYNKWWTELLYREHSIHLNSLHSMFAANATSIIDLWEKKFLTDPSVAGQFGVWRNGRMIWDMGALQGWLQDYADFKGQLLLCCETLSGVPGHGTELTPLTFCSTKE
ncbi:hypothetical protein EDC04DRAFT_2608612 [Pisolithus marmoratus]|nr:hypothetical protein EDC04DRAFT_2608612 [Pisolithus marmoratus]